MNFQKKSLVNWLAEADSFGFVKRVLVPSSYRSKKEVGRMEKRGWIGVVLVVLLFLVQAVFSTQAVLARAELALPLEQDGPKIDLTVPPVVFRVEPLTLKALVTDISGVDSVDALLKLPSGETKQLHLHQDHYGNPDYSVSLPTTLTTKTGTYTFMVFATDIYGNNAYAEAKQLLTAKYALSLKVDPVKVKGGEPLAVSGSVFFDDGSPVPNTGVTLQTPSGKVSVPLESKGMFSYVVNAPANEGNYKVSVQVMSPDEQLFVASESIEVEASNKGSDVSNVGATPAAGSDVPTDVPTTTDTAAAPATLSASSPAQESRTQESAPVQEKVREAVATQALPSGAATSAQSDVPAATEALAAADASKEAQKEEVSSPGVASASALFSVTGLSLGSLISGLVLLTILMSVLVGVGWKKDQPLSRKDILHHEMNTYLWKRWLQKESPNSRYLKR